MADTSDSSSSRLPRRTVLQWIAGAAAASATSGLPGLSLAQAQAPAATTGYGTDPVLNKAYEPGDVWPLTFTDAQKKTATALADVILPKDHLGPAASDVRVPDYIDEWISAPYPKQQKDRKVILPGLEKFEAFVSKTQGKPFAELDTAKQNEVCEQIVSVDGKSPEAKAQESFLNAFTMVACGAYYSTTEGWAALGYVGNTPLGIFTGPPQEVLDKVGVKQTVE